MQYWTGGLETGMHNVTITHADPSPGVFLDLDKVVVSTWPGFGAATNATSSSAAPT